MKVKREVLSAKVGWITKLLNFVHFIKSIVDDHQKVFFRGTLSDDEAKVTSGVPQVSSSHPTFLLLILALLNQSPHNPT